MRCLTIQTGDMRTLKQPDEEEIKAAGKCWLEAVNTLRGVPVPTIKGHRPEFAEYDPNGGAGRLIDDKETEEILLTCYRACTEYGREMISDLLGQDISPDIALPLLCTNLIEGMFKRDHMERVMMIANLNQSMAHSILELPENSWRRQ